jgi:hypothetical protein
LEGPEVLVEVETEVMAVPEQLVQQVRLIQVVAVAQGQINPRCLLPLRMQAALVLSFSNTKYPLKQYLHLLLLQTGYVLKA